ncbi:cysteine desulfurase-like protein [Agromyces luteolus]|uniref:Cysteine desulfurase-like protein n=1 Tax=Agromyces luteolus TaxID=88373 RepID=A0A7C9LBP4_9MICO|nr:cysteine desulfurase-like protein [Agromyces luteolus]MUN05712.1 cysteine desulfurase-like protein [Agromyces luteolus]GLK26257.1 cysteine desulfurase-like protein [Agromyces luteolus]
MAYDVARIRSWFPSLEHGWALFDGPGGTQAPRQVGEAIATTLTGPLSNRGQLGESAQRADAAVAAFRDAVADLTGADPRGVVHGRSATQLVYDFSRHLSRGWGPGDEVVVTRLDHDANVRPWVQAAERRGATVRWVAFDPATGELPVAAVASALTDRTRLVAVTAASNLIGTMPDVPAIAEAVHAVGALLFVDGVHYAAHELPDLGALGADFFTCSPYKFLGPHCGLLVADPALLETIAPDKLLPATDVVPERFEFGTLPYELLAGVTAAIDVLASLADPATDASGSRRTRLAASYAALHEHESRLLARLESALADLPGTTVHSRASRRTPTLLASFAGHEASAVSEALAADRVLAPSGNFYALEASRHLGLGDDGGLRIGLAPYTDDEDVERLIAGLRLAVR